MLICRETVPLSTGEGRGAPTVYCTYYLGQQRSFVRSTHSVSCQISVIHKNELLLESLTLCQRLPSKQKYEMLTPISMRLYLCFSTVERLTLNDRRRAGRLEIYFDNKNLSVSIYSTFFTQEMVNAVCKIRGYR